MPLPCSRAFARLAAIAVLAGISLAAVAADSSSNALTLREAIRATLASNPDLKSFAYTLQAQDARIRSAAQTPAIELSVEVENVLGTGSVRGLKEAETTFALSRVVELGGKSRLRVDAAQAERDGLTIDRRAAQLDQLAEVTRRFVHVACDQKQLELTAEAVRLASGTVEAVKRRVDAAKSPEVELHRANVELIRAEVELEHAEHEYASSKVLLAAMWGETQPRFEAVNADLYALPTPESFDAFASRLQRSPDFTRFASIARLRDAEVRLAQSQRKADFTLSAGVRRLDASDDHAFVAGFSMPFGSRTRAQPAIDAATALASAVELQKTSAIVNARAQLFAIYQELRHEISEAATLRDRVLPQIQEALRETEYAYERGRYGYLELVDAQRAYLEVQRALIEASANSHTFRAELERLTAEPLSDSGELP
jgi:cobalt-zinc-cadmium efflux system outer membrane protein